MDGKPSKADQETAVAAGLAAGCINLGISAVTSAVGDLESAFRRAWQSWPPAVRFPAVRPDMTNKVLVRIMHASPRRRGAVVAEWQPDGPWWIPTWRFDADLYDPGEMLEENTGLPSADWTELAERFAGHLDEDQVRRC
ncbi:hypothetical protein [Saccharothrix syringae]|uniref:Uncharacterized protein n=1 Tax=Saccharothrix syringae TaxID=103733 RepID=A0A5Q0GWS8_SACSY|nr:hypothetical protein [Saccharothrix syringae]QFZ18507.1 hypothetical protein EKG83_14425 [Saccharothrix syringae]